VTEKNKSVRMLVVGYLEPPHNAEDRTRQVLHNDGDLPEWSRLPVVGIDGIGYPVWMPKSRAKRFQIGDLVTFTCRFVQWRFTWYIVAIRAPLCSESGEPLIEQRMVHVGRRLRCQYCGDRIEEDELEWGFDEQLRPECATCYAFRGDRNPDDFRRLCEKIAMHSRTRR
jgi:hypothetical protein